MEITFLGHASFAITSGETVVYIDPYKLVGRLPSAEIVLITHPHFDHCSADDLSGITNDDTVLIAPAGCNTGFKTKVIKCGNEIEIGKISIKAVPAYNIGKNFHPKEEGWIGYIIAMEGYSIYHAGDTDIIPEMADISVDIALLPIGGTYTMDLQDALCAVDMINPRFVIPMHYGEIVGSIEDAVNFCYKCPVPCRTLQKGESWEIKLK